MTDRAAVVLAVATIAGAVAARGPSPWLGAVVVIVAFVLGRPVLLCLGAAVLASGLAAGAWRAVLEASPPNAPFNGEVTLVSDPAPVPGGVGVDVRADRHRFAAVARGPAAAAIAGRLAGERLEVVGRTRPLGLGGAAQRVRHVVGRLDIESVRAAHPARPIDQAANSLRRTLARGAGVLDLELRALFAGMLLGDDREQSPTQVDDFRAAGLSHLLVVSGQNVAFVLVLAAPVVRRLSLWVRLPVTLVVLGSFALLTRFEPSVLRAVAMAAIGVLAATIGRPASSLRVLSLAVTGLVLVDPFLVRSTGFQLSVAASAGIVLASAGIAARLPGPRLLAGAAAVSVAAQLGVAPLLVMHFGGVPVAALPANLVAVPAAGPVMVWGLTAGLVAGLSGPAVASMLHVPTRLLVGWVARVAEIGAAVPLGELRAPHLVACLAGLSVALRAWPTRRRIAAAAALLVGVSLGLPAIQLRGTPPLHVTATDGVELWREGDVSVVVVGSRSDARRALEGLRRRGVGRVAVLVVLARSPGVDQTAVALIRRYRPAVIMGPGLAGGPRLVPGTAVDVGGLRVEVTATRPRLVVAVVRRAPL